jgi:hypothetical protein
MSVGCPSNSGEDENHHQICCRCHLAHAAETKLVPSWLVGKRDIGIATPS